MHLAGRVFETPALDYPILLDPALNLHTFRATWLNADVVDGAEPGAPVGVLARQVDLL